MKPTSSTCLQKYQSRAEATLFHSHLSVTPNPMKPPLPNSGRRSRIAVAADYVLRAFSSCSGSTHSHTPTISNFSKPPSVNKTYSVVSSTSGGGSDKSCSSSRASTRGSSRGSSYGSSHGSSRGIYGSSKVTIHGREAGSVKFTMEEICKATRNFSPSSKIGQGGFGIVYKGTLEDGTHVAIKRAKKGIYKKHLGVEFQSEIKTLAKAEHMNLVKFYGYLEYESERIVVLEYVPNGTLREHLDGADEAVLDLAARLDISIDVAHAITYLHMYADHPIIHRDIKSTNILLTQTLRAKVADFGFARLGADVDSGATHVSTQVKGTAGYLDPEYLKTSQLTEKSDVYSFGILLVELVSGRRPIEVRREMRERITTRWAMKKLGEGEAVSTVDPRLERLAASDVAVEKMLEVAMKCLGPRGKSRPSMRECAEVLWSIRKEFRRMGEGGSDMYSLSSHSQRTVSVIEE